MKARFKLRGMGFQIPTLAEVLAVIPPTTFISVEVKVPGIVALVAAALQDRPQDHVAVGSVDQDIAHQLSHALPNAAHYQPAYAATCFDVGTQTLSSWSGCVPADILATPTSKLIFDFDERGLIESAHDLGMAVFYWTINDPNQMRQLIGIGADGIITDRPERAVRAIADATDAGATE
jgi:glycerophosphoryl diester phosphodiesterase